MTNTMNKKEKGIIAAKIIEAGYLRSQSNPFIWAIRNACFIANIKEENEISFLLSVCTIKHGEQESNNASVITCC